MSHEVFHRARYNVGNTGFARAIGTHYRPLLTRLNVPRDVSQCGLHAIGQRDLIQFNQGRWCASFDMMFLELCNRV